MDNIDGRVLKMMDVLYDEKLKFVDPVTPAAVYIGGKSRLAKTIVKIIEDIPHSIYAEFFSGVVTPLTLYL